MTTLLWSALVLGFAGSLHCASMCGPIALAIPMTTSDRARVVFQSLFYQLGRITSYAIMGGILGFMGWGVTLAGYQKGFSIALGVLIILVVVFPSVLRFSSNKYEKFSQWLKNAIGKALSINSNSAAFKVGLLNGILPCGLVYMALIGALASGEIMEGMLFMTAFGLGTLPMMMGILVFRNSLPRNVLSGFQKLIPLFLIAFAFLLIWRGIMLDVPLEIKFWEANNFPIMCH